MCTCSSKKHNNLLSVAVLSILLLLNFNIVPLLLERTSTFEKLRDIANKLTKVGMKEKQNLRCKKFDALISICLLLCKAQTNKIRFYISTCLSVAENVKNRDIQ